MTTSVGRWVRQPQSVWLRKALFQIHLWTGIGLGLYIFVVSLSGSAIVFRPELSNKFYGTPTTVPIPGTPMPLERLRDIAQRAYPDYAIGRIYSPKTPDRAIEVWFERNGQRTGRLFDPYTGEDLGNAVPLGMRIVDWLIDLHDNLLGGPTGRQVNGVGGLLLIGLCVTGAVIWWPGVKNWRRSLGIRRTANWKQLNWDLHSAIGFWTVAFVFMWALTGVYLVFQVWFNAVVDFLEPFDESREGLRVGDQILRTLYRLHFGRAYGLSVKVLWVVLGAMPALLFITGVLMWWNRVLRRWLAVIPSKVSRNGRQLERIRSQVPGSGLN